MHTIYLYIYYILYMHTYHAIPCRSISVHSKTYTVFMYPGTEMLAQTCEKACAAPAVLKDLPSREPIVLYSTIVLAGNCALSILSLRSGRSW